MVYLKSHIIKAIKYGELKERLANEFPKDIEGYSLGKEQFVKSIEK